MEDIIKQRTLVTKLEISLYALPDDFIVHRDQSERPVAEIYRITRNKKAYQSASNSYKQLVSPTEMYTTIKRHLLHEQAQLKKLEAGYDKPIQVNDQKLMRYTRILEQLRKPTGPNILLELQPRWTRRSDNEEELYEEAVSLVARTQIADVTLIRDNLSIGQNQANSFMQRLEDEDLVSKPESTTLKRTVLITVDDMNIRKI